MVLAWLSKRFGGGSAVLEGGDEVYRLQWLECIPHTRCFGSMIHTARTYAALGTTRYGRNALSGSDVVLEHKDSSTNLPAWLWVTTVFCEHRSQSQGLDTRLEIRMEWESPL